MVPCFILSPSSQVYLHPTDRIPAPKVSAGPAADGARYYLARSSDKAEFARLSTQHDIWVLYQDGKLYTAPISPSLNSILDLGYGSGAWKLSAAALYPSATVLGVDFTPPSSPTASKNCRFVAGNIEEDWSFVPPGVSFDFIYARMLGNGIHNWPALFARCHAALTPGGWIEIPDVYPATLSAKNSHDLGTSSLWRWFELFRVACIRTGIDMRANTQHAAQLREAGFVNIKGKEIEWPVGGKGWGTEKERTISDMESIIIPTLIDGVTELN